MKNLNEIYKYREMLISLVRRDLRGRYKASVLGFMWTFINPLLQLIVYTIVFSVIMKAGIDNFYMFLFVALVPWLFFSSSLTGGASSIVSNGDMVKKIYFPRIILPLAFTTSCFVNMLFCFVVIFAVILVSGFGINIIAILFLPIVMIIEYFLCIGISLIVSSLTVYLRDFEHILSIISMAWMYLTPIVYKADSVPEKYQGLYNINPMVSIITAYRDILYYKRIPELETLIYATVLGVICMAIGYVVFQKLQKGFAEEL